MELLTIAQVAIQFNVSTTYLYKLIRTKDEMKNFVVKKGKRKTYLKSEVIEYLTDSIGLKFSSLSSLKLENKRTNKETNKENIEKTKEILSEPIESVHNKIREPKTTEVNLSELIETLKKQLETKDNLINELIEKDKQERHRSDTIIMTLTQQIQTQSKQLEDLRTKKTETLKPKKQTQPLKKEFKQQEPELKPTFKQKIIYFFKPHLQRKRA